MNENIPGAGIDGNDIPAQAGAAAFSGAGNMADAVQAATTKMADGASKFPEAAQKRFEGAGDALKAATQPIQKAAAPVQEAYTQYLSPTITSQGADFGKAAEAIENDVILRIEITTASEVKAMRAFSAVLAVLAFFFQLVVIAMKYNKDPNVELRKNNAYFITTLAFTCVFMAVLLLVAGIFFRRLIHARRNGLKWSKRRWTIAQSTLLVLIAQIVNVACMLAAFIYAVSSKCTWQTQAMYALGYVQWTMQNVILLLLIAISHNGSLWTGKVKSSSHAEAENKSGDDHGGKSESNGTVPRSASPVTNTTTAVHETSPVVEHSDRFSPSVALVMDAPWTIHIPKLIIFALLQTTLTFMYLKFALRGYGNTSCLGTEPLVCGPPTTAGTVALAFHVVFLWVYFFTYLYFSWRTASDIRSRSYHEMRFARMVFGVMDKHMFPVFFIFTLCNTLVLTVDLTNCWTFVEI